MRLLRQRPSALEFFLLAIFVTAVLSSFLAIYRDIQVHSRFYASRSGDDHFSISGNPVSHARLPERLVLMALLLVTFIGVRMRKFGAANVNPGADYC